MATLALVTAVDTDPEGDWITPGGDTDDIAFRTVGFNDAYTDAQAAKHRRLARAYEGDVGRVPTQLLRKANLEALLKHCVSGVKNLTSADGAEVTWEQVKTMVFDPKYKPLADAMFKAARMAAERRQADLDDAEGNSERS